GVARGGPMCVRPPPAPPPVHSYRGGTWGPEEADAIVADSDGWYNLRPTLERQRSTIRSSMTAVKSFFLVGDVGATNARLAITTLRDDGAIEWIHEARL